MPIETLKVERLSAFASAEFEFVPGINVLLGANSTGKTHLLKWLYASTKTFERPLSEGEDPSEMLKTKLAGVFLPDERRVGRLVKRSVGGSTGQCVVRGTEGSICFTVSTLDRVTVHERAWAAQAPAVFLPSREVLALYEGFVAAYTNRELSIDETYYDVCVALSAAGLRGPRGALASALMDSVDQALGGKVALDGSRFYIAFDADVTPRLEAHLVAEGLRKIGSLARLIQNGTLLQQGLLMWDEPEASLNPRLISAVARILMELARAGVQVVIATHDYLLAKRISMAAEHDRDAPPTRFFLLSRPGQNEAVVVSTGGTLSDLPRTPMEEEFLSLYHDEQRAFADDAE